MNASPKRHSKIDMFIKTLYPKIEHFSMYMFAVQFYFWTNNQFFKNIAHSTRVKRRVRENFGPKIMASPKNLITHLQSQHFQLYDRGIVLHFLCMIPKISTFVIECQNENTEWARNGERVTKNSL